MQEITILYSILSSGKKTLLLKYRGFFVFCFLFQIDLVSSQEQPGPHKIFILKRLYGSSPQMRLCAAGRLHGRESKCGAGDPYRSVGGTAREARAGQTPSWTFLSNDFACLASSPLFYLWDFPFHLDKMWFPKRQKADMRRSRFVLVPVNCRLH